MALSDPPKSIFFKKNSHIVFFWVLEHFYAVGAQLFIKNFFQVLLNHLIGHAFYFRHIFFPPFIDIIMKKYLVYELRYWQKSKSFIVASVYDGIYDKLGFFFVMLK